MHFAKVAPLPIQSCHQLCYTLGPSLPKTTIADCLRRSYKTSSLVTLITSHRRSKRTASNGSSTSVFTALRRIDGNWRPGTTDHVVGNSEGIIRARLSRRNRLQGECAATHSTPSVPVEPRPSCSLDATIPQTRNRRGAEKTTHCTNRQTTPSER